MNIPKFKILCDQGINYFIPFVVITSCFALWGIANDITNPMVKTFSKIFRMSVFDGTLIQVAFYGGYFVMALPAAMLISKFSYKTGVLTGLLLYAIGAFLFLPAQAIGSYYPFLIAYFIMTCGLSFLETSSNPFILSMGSEKTATRRLNLAQSFNPLGSLMGMFVAMQFIQGKINPLSTEERSYLSEAEFSLIKAHDLEIVSKPYIWIGVIILVLFFATLLIKMPNSKKVKKSLSVREFISDIFNVLKIKHYREGVLTQFFYVGAQIMCWTFIIQLGTFILTNIGLQEKEAEIISQKYNILAMVLFCISRFVCTYLLKYIKPSILLMFAAIGGVICMLGVILFHNIYAVYSLVATSVFMAPMFPTIYSLSLRKLKEKAKIGSAGLIMAILGGSLLPAFQAKIIDLETIIGFSAVALSFCVPLLAFFVILAFSLKCFFIYDRRGN